MVKFITLSRVEMNKKVVIMASDLLFVLVSSVCFTVGYSLLKDDGSSRISQGACDYSQQEYVVPSSGEPLSD